MSLIQYGVFIWGIVIQYGVFIWGFVIPIGYLTVARSLCCMQELLEIPRGGFFFVLFFYLRPICLF